MKNLLKNLVASTAIMLLFAGAALAQNGNGTGNGHGNGLVGRAIGAFNSDCPSAVNGPLNGYEETVGICINGGFITRVLIFRQLNCQQINCLAVRLAPIGYVDFDCENNLMNVSCTWP